MTSDIEDLTERAPSLDRDGRAAYRVTTNDTKLSTAIVRAVAEIADCDPTADEEVLYDVVDPDALDRLFADCHDGTVRASGRVVFELRGCRIQAYADGEFVVYEPTEDRGAVATSAAQSA